MSDKPKVISLSGYIGSGKTAFAEQFVVQQWQKPGGQEIWHVKSWAAKLKKVAAIMLNVPVSNFESQEFKASLLPEEWQTPVMQTYREFLQRLGTDAVRDHVNEKAWLNALWVDLEPKDQWILMDTRFPNEIESAREKDAIIVRINRGPRTNHHSSETSIDEYKDWDWLVDNTGDFSQLKREVRRFADHFGL